MNTQTTHIPIISKYWMLWLGVSALLLTIAIGSLVLFKLNLGIDFTGGTELEFTLKATNSDVREDQLQASVEQVATVESVESLRDSRFLIHLPVSEEGKREQINETITKDLGTMEDISSTQVGAVIGKELVRKTITGIVIALFCIVAYTALRFRSLLFGLSALLAVAHDIVIVLGAYSLAGRFFGAQADVLFVTAILTILSFSVHDTIVVYDRIRERMKKQGSDSFTAIVDQSVTDTVVRSIRNSLTIIFVLAAILFLGPVSLRWFVSTLLVGTVLGTYSSTFVALPLLLLSQRLPTLRKK